MPSTSPQSRSDLHEVRTDLPDQMSAVVLTGHGGFDKLDFRTDVAVPKPMAGDVLLRVGAAGVNNTDINTRTGWYSKSIRSGTDAAAAAGYDEVVGLDGGWAGEGISFPRIQGADAAGVVVGIGAGVDATRIGQRVLVRTIQSAFDSDDPTACITLGSEIDGAFAQYLAVRSEEAFAITTDLTDIELASFPCAYSTAEGMLHRVGVVDGERIVVTGASGGVGGAAVQLAKRRGAHVTAIASQAKWEVVRDLGADAVLDRGADLVDELGPESVDVAVDVVAGEDWPSLLDVLKKQGRYVTSGAIAGPIVELDVRTLYLKDLTLLGCTFQPREVFENLVTYIERGEIRPVVAASYELAEIVEAQKAFLDKAFAGKLVLVPPASGR